jgi:hypothetical protein
MGKQKGRRLKMENCVKLALKIITVGVLVVWAYFFAMCFLFLFIGYPIGFGGYAFLIGSVIVGAGIAAYIRQQKIKRKEIDPNS